MRLPVLFLFAISTLGLAAPAQSNVSASIVILEAAPGFESKRTYAGQTVAARSSELGFKRAGQITHVYVDIGTKIEAGAPLAQLDVASAKATLHTADADIAVANAALAAAEAQLRLARNTERRFHRLRAEGHTPQQVYDEARLNLEIKLADRSVAKAQLARVKANRRIAQIALDDATLYAPFSGTIQARHVDEGTQVLPGQSALRIVESGQVEVHIGIPSRAAAMLQDDQTYQLDWQDETFTAQLTSVLPEIDPTTRTQTAVLTTQAHHLPLGSVVELHLHNFIASPGFWVPMSALVESERGLWGAYVVNQNNVAERRLVEVVHTEADRVFVRGTLTQGERLVSSGVHRIVPGQVVNPIGVLADAR